MSYKESVAVHQDFVNFLYKTRNYTPQDLAEIANIPINRVPQDGNIDISMLTKEDLVKLDTMKEWLDEDSQIVA